MRSPLKGEMMAGSYTGTQVTGIRVRIDFIPLGRPLLIDSLFAHLTDWLFLPWIMISI
jgi:hypothetical protein